jgi:hypothetical protein
LFTIQGAYCKTSSSPGSYQGREKVIENNYDKKSSHFEGFFYAPDFVIQTVIEN